LQEHNLKDSVVEATDVLFDLAHIGGKMTDGRAQPDHVFPKPDHELERVAGTPHGESVLAITKRR
jgi:hypothetical protein